MKVLRIGILDLSKNSRNPNNFYEFVGDRHTVVTNHNFFKRSRLFFKRLLTKKKSTKKAERLDAPQIFKISITRVEKRT